MLSSGSWWSRSEGQANTQATVRNQVLHGVVWIDLNSFNMQNSLARKLRLQHDEKHAKIDLHRGDAFASHAVSGAQLVQGGLRHAGPLLGVIQLMYRLPIASQGLVGLLLL